MDKNIVLDQTAAYFQDLDTQKKTSGNANSIDSDDYSDLMDFINQHYTDGLDSILEARVNDDGTTLCVGLDGTKKVAVKITGNHIEIRLLSDDTASMSEAEFRTTSATQLVIGAKKKKQCKNGLSCGGSCISRTKTCFIALSASDRSLIDSLKKKIKAIEKASGKTVGSDKPAMPKQLQALQSFDKGKDAGKSALKALDNGLVSAYTKTTDKGVQKQAAEAFDKIYSSLSNDEKNSLAKEYLLKHKGRDLASNLSENTNYGNDYHEAVIKNGSQKPEDTFLIDFSNRSQKIADGELKSHLDKEHRKRRKEAFFRDAEDEIEEY